jgi:hypothetical protein
LSASFCIPRWSLLSRGAYDLPSPLHFTFFEQ